jgi:competence protein ComEC
MSLSRVQTYKQAPFLRILPPFIAGVLFQWYLESRHWLLLVILAVAMLVLILTQTVTLRLRFRLQWLTGAALNVILISTGALVVYFNHPANKQGWLPKLYTGHECTKAVLQEPLTAKKGSYKATAAVKQLITNGNTITVSGNIIIYFSPAVKVTDLSYGSIIIINKPLIPVKSSGNPSAFNYQRYCMFAGISHQVFLQPQDFAIAQGSETRSMQQLIFYCRQSILNTLSTFIKNPRARALAEALLIGYKDELDKNLVQAYSNTGVVHIIAVSGMHLGIIYLLLGYLLHPLRKNHYGRGLSFISILAGLWIFSLLAGAGPSVIRSAVMFSIMLIGNTFSRRSNIYNTLAASAFVLLCWNPFWLWDAGFQLSYAAVLSIVMFFRPVYNLIFVENKLLNAVWKLNAVTISAQLLTLPLTIYLFHQFPNLFLLTNLIAVPLSGILLIGEIVLCAVSFIPLIAAPIGDALGFLISFMNDFIERIDTLPFATWTHLYITLPQAALLTILILCRSRIPALACIMLFMVLRAQSFVAANHKQQMIVYNVAKKTGIDFIQGRKCYFIGDPPPEIESSRTIQRTTASDSLSGLLGSGPLFWFNGKRIFIMDKIAPGFPVDVLILSKNTFIPLQSVQVKQVVADGSNSARKLKQWAQECNALHIPFHSVVEDGAFIFNAH